MKILAVDDEELILDVLRLGLKSNGFENVDFADSARGAIVKVRSAVQPYDCLMLDIQMPGMNGIDLCRWFRQQQGYLTTPIVMVTSMSDRSHVRAAFDAGATDYVTKPFDPFDLGARLGVAERLRVETVRAKESGMALRLLKLQFEAERRVGFSKPLTIRDVPGVIGLVNLENYLLQMSRIGLISTTIVAVLVRGIETLHSRLLPSDYELLLSEFADALSCALRGREFFLAYAGSGKFAAVVHSHLAASSEEIEDLANCELYRGVGNDQVHSRLPIRFKVGKPVRIGVMRSSASAVQAMYQTLAELNETPIRHQSKLTPARI